MTSTAEAWVLYEGDLGTRGELVRETIDVRAPSDDEIIARPLYGCWEGNMHHALDRRPIDVCRARGERKVVLGNAGVVRVEQVGRNVDTVRVGDAAIVFCNGTRDRHGYPETIFGYDARGTTGLLATRTTLAKHQVIPIPRDSRYSLVQWAAFSLRYVTAWSNWDLAYRTFRIQVPEDELPAPHVWGWGGGTTLAELDLARRHGCKAVMLSGSDAHLSEIRGTGVTALDRRQFGALQFEEESFAKEPSREEAYRTAERAFLETVGEMTGGDMVQIFVDYIGAPVWRATLKATSREAVITSAGWKEGMRMSNLRANECIKRRQHVHTHYARYEQGKRAVAYAEAQGWMPRPDERVHAFGEVPALAEAHRVGKTGFFPCFAVSPD